MMKVKSFARILMMIPMLTGLLHCSRQEQQATTAASNMVADPAAAKTEGAVPAASGCCFTQREDFAPYIPAGDDMLTPHGNGGFASNFFCGADEDDKRSSATASFQIDKAGTKDPMLAKYLSLQIVDLCANPGSVGKEIERRALNDKKYSAGNPNVTVTEFNDGTAFGYRYTDITKGNNSQNVHLWAAIGDRFKLHISGIDHVRMDMVDRLYRLIPVAQLAGER